MRGFCPSVRLLFVLLASGLWLGSATAQESAKPAASSSGTAAVGGAAATSGVPSADADDAPTTVKTASDASNKKPVDTDPVFGVPPLPKGITTLVGGTVSGIDGVHNRLGVKVFGGGHWTIAFDERTHFFRDGTETTFEKIKKGDRVYVDTMLDNHRVFARNVHIVTHTGPADASGQVTAFNNGTITLRDSLSAAPLQVRVDGSTQVKRNGSASSGGPIQPGSLVLVQFAPERENRGVARQVTILAEPGQTFTFAGKVMHIDLRNNHVAIENSVDSKTYEIAVDRQQIPQSLTIGSQVTIAAVFNGRDYKASSIDVK